MTRVIRTPSLVATCLVLATSLLGAEGPAPPPAAEPPLQVCLATAADLSPVYPTSVLPSTVRELSCCYRLDAGQAARKLTSVWIAVDVGTAAPPNYEIARADLADPTPIGRFHYSQDNPLPAGKYRLDVLADGAPWRHAEFTVAPAAPPLRIEKASEAFPLAEGRTWTYAFVMQAGQGTRVKIPGVEPGADGKLRAVVTMAVGKAGKPGTRVEFRRNDAPLGEEWWRLEETGLVVVQRKYGDESAALDPPQTLLALPLEPLKAWTWKSRDGSQEQKCTQWGPLPVRGPEGETPGYVVLVEQATPLGRVTAERHFVPGYGMVRQVVVSSLGANLLTREELTLAAPKPAPPAKEGAAPPAPKADAPR